MFKTGYSIFMVIFWAYCKDNAKGFKRLYIALEFIIGLGNARFLTYLYPVNTVISNNSAPEGIVKIKRKGFLILAENRFDNIWKIEGKFGNSLKAHCIFIHIPVWRIAPCFQTIGSGNEIYIIYIEALIVLWILIEFIIQTGNIIWTSPVIGAVLIAHKPVKRHFKVILNDGTMIGFAYLLPHSCVFLIFPFKHPVHILTAVRCCGICGNVPVCRMDPYYIRLEFKQLFTREHCVLPVLGIFRLIEFRLYSLIEQKKLQMIDDRICCWTAENSDFLFKSAAAVRKQSPLYWFFLFDNIFAVKRIL